MCVSGDLLGSSGSLYTLKVDTTLIYGVLRWAVQTLSICESYIYCTRMVERLGTSRFTIGYEIPLRNRPVYQAVEHPA